MPNHIAHRPIGPRIRAVRRHGELEGSLFRATDADNEQTIAVLGQAIIPSIQRLPRNSVTCGPEADKLIPQKVFVVREPHSVHILDDEGQRAHLAQRAVEMLIEVVDLV